MVICDPLVHSTILDSRVSQGDTEWLCLLYSVSSGNARDDTIAIRLNDGAWPLETSCLGPGYCGSTMPTRVLCLPLFDGFVSCYDVIGS